MSERLVLSVPSAKSTRHLADAHCDQRGTRSVALRPDDKTMGEIIQFPGGALNADSERQAAVAEVRILLEGAIDALPASFRTVFILRHVEDLSTEETAHTVSASRTPS
jgi:DNA-directed RNA polymerase specialized sigma24 family protein